MNTLLQSTTLISSTGDALMFDELITTVALLHLIWPGHMLLDKSPLTALLLHVYVSVSFARSQRRHPRRTGPRARFRAFGQF